jgi:hypothetical protein
VKDFGIDKKQLAQATKDLKIELELVAEELYTEVGDELYKMAEELLEDFNDGNEKEAADEPWLDEVRTIVAEADAKQKVLKAWANMDDMERAAMAKLVNEWQK